MFSIIAISLLIIGIYLMVLPLLMLFKQLFAALFQLIKRKTKTDGRENSFVQKHLHYMKTKKEEERLNRDWERFQLKKENEYKDYLNLCSKKKINVIIKN